MQLGALQDYALLCNAVTCHEAATQCGWTRCVPLALPDRRQIVERLTREGQSTIKAICEAKPENRANSSSLIQPLQAQVAAYRWTTAVIREHKPHSAVCGCVLAFK